MANLMNENETASLVENVQSDQEESGVNNDVGAGESDLRRSPSTVDDAHNDDEFVAGAEAEIQAEAHLAVVNGGGADGQQYGEQYGEHYGGVKNIEGDCSSASHHQTLDDMAKTSLKQRSTKARQNNSADNNGGSSSSSSSSSNSNNGNGNCGELEGTVQNGVNGERRATAASKRAFPVGFKFKTFALLVVLSFLPIGYLWYKDVLARQVSTKLDAPLVIEEDAGSAVKSPRRFWGTYRPGVYFGLKTRSPHSLVTGLMWFTQFGKDRQLPVRHTCEQGDQLARYGWLEDDGINFGVQEVVDKNFTLKTEFVKQPGGTHGGDWTARFSGKARNKASNKTMVSLVFYTALDHDNGVLQPVVKGNQLLEIRGTTEELGGFSLRFPPPPNVTAFHYVSTYSPSIHLSKEVVMQSLKRFPYPGNKFLAGLAGNILALRGITDYQPNFMAHQVTLSLPFEMEVIFESASHPQRREPLSGEVFTQQLRQHKDAFGQAFEEKFGLKEKGYKKEEVGFAKAALSNMLGGIGYFYGQSTVKSKHTPEPVHYWDAPLLTAVPSRSFFPRGFLWDEGFHNLLISKWDPALSKEIIGHWLDLMNSEGWIPREQILGSEARSKVPEEFVVQNNENANPPTLFLPLQSLLRDTTSSKNGDFLEYLRHVFPRLEAWYRWFNTTQTGPRPSTYRWRGRNAMTDKELNPKTLTSGLDDYPRASHPTDSEFHVDLRCWMTLASGVMVDIARAIKVQSHDYEATYHLLSDNKLLDKLHWSPKGKMYSDYGSHTSAVMLKRPTVPPPPTTKPGQRRPPPPPKLPMVRVIKGQSEPKEQYVDAFGYISLFPFLLQILEPDSSKLGKVLTDLKDPKLLWTKYGLRSLSKSDPIYMKYNTEHDPPYWRGAIWINMNFLAVRSLHHYSHTPGPYQDKAEELYTELRRNLVSNIIKEYKRSGYIWENYNDSTGKGQGSHPFTGWSALVVLMMSEKY